MWHPLCASDTNEVVFRFVFLQPSDYTAQKNKAMWQKLSALAVARRRHVDKIATPTAFGLSSAAASSNSAPAKVGASPGPVPETESASAGGVFVRLDTLFSDPTWTLPQPTGTEK